MKRAPHTPQYVIEELRACAYLIEELFPDGDGVDAAARARAVNARAIAERVRAVIARATRQPQNIGADVAASVPLHRTGRRAA